jgi:non-structural maintenance of chromosomes element 4
VANLDSRLLVSTSDLAKTKARNMVLGDAAFNVDEWVAKCIWYAGGRHRSRSRLLLVEDHEENMDWAALGRLSLGICHRVPTIGFMLGPLSVEKKERKVVRRQHERKENSSVVRPEEVFSS